MEPVFTGSFFTPQVFADHRGGCVGVSEALTGFVWIPITTFLHDVAGLSSTQLNPTSSHLISSLTLLSHSAATAHTHQAHTYTPTHTPLITIVASSPWAAYPSASTSVGCPTRRASQPRPSCSRPRSAGSWTSAFSNPGRVRRLKVSNLPPSHLLPPASLSPNFRSPPVSFSAQKNHNNHADTPASQKTTTSTAWNGASPAPPLRRSSRTARAARSATPAGSTGSTRARRTPRAPPTRGTCTPRTAT